MPVGLKAALESVEFRGLRERFGENARRFGIAFAPQNGRGPLRFRENDRAVAFGLGIIEALVTGYVSSSMKDAVAFLVLICVLYVRPNGLFGSYAT